MLVQALHVEIEMKT